MRVPLFPQWELKNRFHFICSLSATIYHMKALLFRQIRSSATQSNIHTFRSVTWFWPFWFDIYLTILPRGQFFTRIHNVASMPLYHLDSTTAASTIESCWDWKLIVRQFFIELEILLLKGRLPHNLHYKKILDQLTFKHKQLPCPQQVKHNTR